MKERFIDKKFKEEALALIGYVNKIIAEYQAMGYVLSLRQAFYQLVSRNLVPNTEQSYKNVGNTVADGRMAGLIDWAAIEDRGRDLVWGAHWSSPAEIVEACAKQYKIDKWLDQPNFVVVMVEKQALEGVLAPVCRQEDVRFAANKGYGSASFFYEVGQLLAAERGSYGKDVHVLYLGDHDPSGIDMTRDVRERLELFSRGCVEVHRLALNYDQVEQYQPPNNPAKLTDSRATDYVRRFGYDSWELDALAPNVLADLVTNFIRGLRDDNGWDQAMIRERSERGSLKQVAAGFSAGTLTFNDSVSDESENEEEE